MIIPKKAKRNRLLQTVRNKQAKARRLNAKMDASSAGNIKVVGRYWLAPVIAKMDALEVNIVVLSRSSA